VGELLFDHPEVGAVVVREVEIQANLLPAAIDLLESLHEVGDRLGRGLPGDPHADDAGVVCSEVQEFSSVCHCH
jgi:hypothetical protein